jgi:hypothetical protein
MIEFIVFVVSIYKGNSLMLSYVKGKKILLETAAFKKKRFRCFKEVHRRRQISHYHWDTGGEGRGGKCWTGGSEFQQDLLLSIHPSIHV